MIIIIAEEKLLILIQFENNSSFKENFLFKYLYIYHTLIKQRL